MSTGRSPEMRSAHILDDDETITICAHIHRPSQKSTFYPRRWLHQRHQDFECTNAFDRLVKPLLDKVCFTEPVRFSRFKGSATRLHELSEGMRVFQRPTNPTYLLRRLKEERDLDESYSVLALEHDNYLKVAEGIWFRLSYRGSRITLDAVHEIDHRRVLGAGTHFFV